MQSRVLSGQPRDARQPPPRFPQKGAAVAAETCRCRLTRSCRDAVFSVTGGIRVRRSVKAAERIGLHLEGQDLPAATNRSRGTAVTMAANGGGGAGPRFSCVRQFKADSSSSGQQKPGKLLRSQMKKSRPQRRAVGTGSPRAS